MNPGLALGSLEALAPSQGDSYDDRHDQQPGKIEHEYRRGELAHFDQIPQTPYYGTHDTTALYVWAAAALWRWTGKRESMNRLRPHVERALAWIDRDGDIDDDGLQEYQTRAGDWGYYNQSWKDSGIAIVNSDGTNATLPIATCELQGYVVAAKRGWASVVEQAFDDPATAARLRDEADRLAELVDQRFWWAAEGTYYLGLDGDKRPIETVASNAGHLLWTGAVPPDRASSVAHRLLEEDMWSGWGVRTLSTKHAAYNPLSYQLGSVWPHDNAIIANGLARYGHSQAGSADRTRPAGRRTALPTRPAPRSVRWPRPRRGILPRPIPGSKRPPSLGLWLHHPSHHDAHRHPPRRAIQPLDRLPSASRMAASSHPHQSANR